MSVGTESVWCSRAYSDSCKPLTCKQGEEIYDDLNANWRLPKGSAQWSWIVLIYLDLPIQLRNRRGSVLRVQPTRCNFSQFILFIPVRRSTGFRRGFRQSPGAQNCTYSVRYLSDYYCYLLPVVQVVPSILGENPNYHLYNIRHWENQYRKFLLRSVLQWAERHWRGFSTGTEVFLSVVVSQLFMFRSF